MGCNNSKSDGGEPKKKEDKPQKQEEKPQEEEKKEEQAEQQQEEQANQKQEETPPKEWMTKDEAVQYVQSELGIKEENAEKFVARANKDNDDRVSKKEVDKIKEEIEKAKEEIVPLFEEKDKDNNGWVTGEDAKEIIQKKFPSFTEQQVDIMASKFDADGKVQTGEFILFYCRITAMRENIMKDFDEIDDDDTGKLGRKEVVEYLQEKCDMARYMADAIFEINAGKDECMSKQEFRKMFNKEVA